LLLLKLLLVDIVYYSYLKICGDAVTWMTHYDLFDGIG